MRKIVFLAALAAASCGGSPSGDFASATCSITLSGAVNGAFSCANFALGTYTTSTNQSAVSFSSTGATTLASPDISVSIQFPGSMRAGTFSLTDAGAGGGILVNAGGNWVAESAQGSNPAVGSYALGVSSFSIAGNGGSGQAYTVHGTLTATLQPLASTGATGSISLHAVY
jgi:hypothetical protein